MTRKLLYLNGLAILAVILFHSAGWGFTAMFSWAHRYLTPDVNPFSQVGSPTYFLFRVIEQLAVFSIPAFLFVSGFFVAFNTPAKENTISWKKVLNRLKFLIIPYLAWSLIIFFLNALQGKFPGLQEFIINILTGSTTPAYYFVILLIQMYLISPLLVPLAKRHWIPLLLVMFLIQAGVNLLQYPLLLNPQSTAGSFALQFLPKWLFLSRLFWFVLGMVIGFHKELIQTFILKNNLLWGSIMVVSFFAGILEWEWLMSLSMDPWIEHRETLIDTIFSIAFIFTFLSLAQKSLYLMKPVEQVGSQSFGIYLVHIPVMELVARGIYHLFPDLLGFQAIFMVIIGFTGLMIPVALMQIIKNLPVRRWYAFAFG